MNFWLYLLVMGLVTYLIRAIPLLFVKKNIENQFIKSFLHYIPNAILAAMTIPAIFYATGNMIAAAAGFAIAMILAFFRKSLLTVALAASITVFAIESLMKAL